VDQEAGRVAEEWADRSFPVLGRGQAVLDNQEDRRRSSRDKAGRDNVGGLRRTGPGCNLGRRDAGGTTNRW